MARRRLAAGNWKMNGLTASLAELRRVAEGAGNAACDVAVCPPATLVAAAVAAVRGSTERIGREQADATRILYGGSVKADNAGDIAKISGVDGALVGGASLKAADFLAIIAAFG